MPVPNGDIGVGLVGWGYASATFHSPLIQATPGLRLVAVSSQRPATELPAGQPFDWVRGIEALLARPDVDLVVIPTPNDTHHALAAQALAAGKHVVLDKPFTVTLTEADDLIARARQANRLLSVFHNRRWDGDFLGLQALLASGVLGRVTRLDSRFDRYRPDVRPRWRESAAPGGGLWFDLGPHLLDQALQLFGPPESIWLDTVVQRDAAVADDGFVAVLRYPGKRAVLQASALTAHLAPRFTVHGTAGSYHKQGLDTQEAMLKAGGLPGAPGWGDDPLPGTLTLARGDALQTRQVPSTAGDYRAYYRSVHDALRGVVAAPAVTADEARAVMRLIERGWQSVAEGRVLPV